jgi:NAD dependent epimerase/dehydratase family enzyme
MATIGKVCRAPFSLPAPRWLLEIGAFFMRTETELLIKSRRVVPGKLLANGFTFLHPHLLPAIEQLVAQELKPFGVFTKNNELRTKP